MNDFNPNTYLADQPQIEFLTIQINGQSFFCRLLNEYETRQLREKKIDEFVPIEILARTVLNEKDQLPIGLRKAEELWLKDENNMSELVKKILRKSDQRRSAEQNELERQERFFLENKYNVLKRRYCQRFSLDPESVEVSRAILIREQAYGRLELKGAFTPERSDYIQSSAAWLLLLIASANGWNVNDLNERIVYGFLKLKKKDTPKRTDQIEETNKKTELLFSALAAIFGASVTPPNSNDTAINPVSSNESLL